MTPPRPFPPARPRRRGDRGGATVEVVVLAPVVLLLVMFVVLAGRLSTTCHKVRTAAGDAARAASINPGSAEAEAGDVAAAVLAGNRTSCPSPSTAVDRSHAAGSEAVTVTVTCEVPLAELTGLRLPGTKRVSATAVQVIDHHRSERP